MFEKNPALTVCLTPVLTVFLAAAFFAFKFIALIVQTILS